jgi:hypothetical protein
VPAIEMILEERVEYRIVWLAFFVVLLFLGATTALLPGKVISILRQAPTAPQRGFILVFSGVGGVVAVSSVIEIISILGWGHLL